MVAPHSGTPFDLLETGASAALVIGLCLWLVAWLGDRSRRAVAIVFGAGTMTLSLYSLHVVMRTEQVWPAEEPSSFGWHVLVLLSVGALFVAAPPARAAEAAGGRDQRAPPAPLDGRAGVHHHRHPGRRGPVERVRVDDAELEPHRPRTHLDGLVGELAGRLGTAEDVDHVDGERHVGEGGEALLPEHLQPPSEAAAGWIGTICLPRSWSSAAMEYAVRLVSPESPTTAQTLQSSSMNRIASGSCHVMPKA